MSAIRSLLVGLATAVVAGLAVAVATAKPGEENRPVRVVKKVTKVAKDSPKEPSNPNPAADTSSRTTSPAGSAFLERSEDTEGDNQTDTETRLTGSAGGLQDTTLASPDPPESNDPADTEVSDRTKDKSELQSALQRGSL